MNAPMQPPPHVPDRSPVQTVINYGGHLAALAFDLGACSSSEVAAHNADNLEMLASSWAAMGNSSGGNALNPMLALDLAGDCARRARLWRARAEELRR